MSKQKHTATGNFSKQAPVLVKDQKGKVSAVRYDHPPLKAIELARKKGAHINVISLDKADQLPNVLQKRDAATRQPQRDYRQRPGKKNKE